MGGTVRLDVEGPIATITNANPDRRNAFDDAMDDRFFAVLAEVASRPEIRVVIWRGEGGSFSSGRDVAAVTGMPSGLTHHQLMARVHAGTRRLLALDVPVLVAVQGWAVGVSFQRALLCDIRVASDDARFRLPELDFGLLPDSGGAARLFQMCGHGVASDLVLTGRTLTAHEALAHGIVSRVVPAPELDVEVRAMAEAVAERPPLTAKLARRVIAGLATPELVASMDGELLAQTVVSTSHDHRELRRSRRERREPHYLRG